MGRITLGMTSDVIVMLKRRHKVISHLGVFRNFSEHFLFGDSYLKQVLTYFFIDPISFDKQFAYCGEIRLAIYNQEIGKPAIILLPK